MAKLEQVCDEYLESLSYQQWADWSIKDPERRKLASEWLAEQIRNVGERVMTVHGGTLDTDTN